MITHVKELKAADPGPQNPGRLKERFVDLRDFQQLIDKMYSHKDRERGSARR